MRLMLKVGYNQLLFAKGAEVAAIIAGLDGARAVSETGYGASRKLVLQEDAPVEVSLISEVDAMLPEADDTGKALLVTLTQSVSDLQTKLYASQQGEKKALDALKAVQGAMCVEVVK